MRFLPKIPIIGIIPDFNASQRAIELITINAALGALLFALFNSWTIAIICLFFIAYQYVLIHRQKKQTQYAEHAHNFALPKINNAILFCLLIACIGIILSLYGGNVSSRPATAFLCLLMGLKLLEARDLRGYAVTCLLMYFLAAITFSYENSSIAMMLLTLYCISTTACLYLLYQPQSTLSLKSTLLENGKILLKTIPLTLIIFFLFPRIQGDFGFLPDSDLNSNPGFGDSINAGDLSTSAFSNALAFRVEFTNNKVPERSNLYWRSKVLSIEDGFSWKFSIEKDRPILQSKDASTQNIEGNISYKVIHQATRDFHIPTLEHVSFVSRGAIYNNSTVRIKKPFQGATSYSAVSRLSPVLNTSLNTDSLDDANHYLQTSFSPKRKTQQLIQHWQSQAPTSQALVQLVLNHFRTEPFSYSLLAPAINPAKPIEDFLFNKQSGYCEHYASVFTTLMRWQGIPARVVIGFQGGDWVPEGNFLEVRYSSAHAWSEVWLTGKGWTRIDPTAAIAPERIEFGMDALLALMENNQLGKNIGAQKLADMLRPGGISKAFRKASSLYRSFNHRWDKWIVNFNHERQLEILEKFNISKNNSSLKLFAFMIGLCSLVAAYWLFTLLPRPVQIKPIDKLYQRFLKKLKPLGVQPDIAEGAISFGQRAVNELSQPAKIPPETQTAIIKITQLYTQVKYANGLNQIKELAHMIQQFKPKAINASGLQREK